MFIEIDEYTLKKYSDELSLITEEEINLKIREKRALYELKKIFNTCNNTKRDYMSKILHMGEGNNYSLIYNAFPSTNYLYCDNKFESMEKESKRIDDTIKKTEDFFKRYEYIKNKTQLMKRSNEYHIDKIEGLLYIHINEIREIKIFHITKYCIL
jgi:hypothetical protein